MMKRTICFLLFIGLISCNSDGSKDLRQKMSEQKELTNAQIKSHSFLDCMYKDPYFPGFLVDKCKNILLEFCQEIETTRPSGLEELYKLSHISTNKLNALQNEFITNNSEIETGARECLGADFEFIAKAYHFEADVEELIATREW
jgi:hypothetical protein